ncbi:hypothetical protein C1646_672806 [Rhizophagus diaphanus]|nr:hypothetical protein C1646_672806 [Rhizophagus diaphanus] [Rhizophagus sp. MUCL 43196]
MERYLLYSQNIKESPIARCEAFPGEMLSPSSEKVIMSSEMLDIMVDYYNVTYPANNFQKPFREEPKDSINIRVKMNQFRRCRIGSEIFGLPIQTFSEQNFKGLQVLGLRVLVKMVYGFLSKIVSFATSIVKL